MTSLEQDRPLVPRPRYYSNQLDARNFTPEQTYYTLRYLVQQRLQERQQEELEKEKRKSEKRRQAEIPHDISDKPRRLIPVEPVISPFDCEEKKVPGDDLHIPHKPLEDPDSYPSILDDTIIPSIPIPHGDSTSSEEFEPDIEPDLDMATTGATRDLIDALTRTLKNINQSPTIPLPIFKGKKGEDPEDHILKVEDYFGLHQIDTQGDKIQRFKDTLFETAGNGLKGGSEI